MKNIMAALTLCSVAFASVSCFAESPELAIDSGQVRTIQYTVTVYRDDKNFDVDAWDILKQDARAVIAQGKKSSEQASPSDILQLVMGSVEKLATNSEGIHGTISVAVSNDDCVHKGCGGVCDKSGELTEQECTRSCSETDMQACKQACIKSCESDCEQPEVCATKGCDGCRSCTKEVEDSETAA